MTTTDFACHDAACAPPPVGTGGSSPGGPARGRLSPKANERKNPPQSIVKDAYQLRRHGIRELFDGNLTDDIEFEDVDVQWMGKGGWFIEGHLSTKGGDHVGFFERYVDLVDGKLVATHETLIVEERHQGRGVAQAFNDRLVNWYQEVGVDRIELTAGFDMGPYVWATQGYRIKGEGGENRKRWVDDRLTKISQESDDPDLKLSINALRKANGRGEDVQPIHVASLGQDDPALHWQDEKYGTMWPGKSVLIDEFYKGSDDRSREWDGVYYLEGKPQPATVASALKYLSDQG